MEAYGKILLIAMPAFLLLVLFEKWYGWYKDNDTVRGMDMLSSLSSGVTNVTKDVLGLSFLNYFVCMAGKTSCNLSCAINCLDIHNRVHCA